MPADEPWIPDATDFISEQVRADLADGAISRVVTRFPPEPNGYLHVGHALSICLNFGIAAAHGGQCNLRFDDTNPRREEQEYIEAIQRDIAWLGYVWAGEPRFASDYFEQLYAWAEHLITAGKAYVDDLSADEIRAYRGTLMEPGRPSPCRDRPAAESLDLFRRMRAGAFPEGALVLRARIDMGAGNINLRDPVLYRILHVEHPRTGKTWCIYPTYDFAHGQSDAIEGVTHSLCTLEFADHRPLYDWFIAALPVSAAPRQYEFAKLQISYTVLSKRRMTRLVSEGHVRGWDDPRMATLSGLRRRGVSASALRNFVARLSISKNEGVVEMTLLEHCIREELNRTAERRMAVLRPLKLVVESYPDDETEMIEALNNPGNPDAGTRNVPFTRTLWVEQDDFMETPSRKFHRLTLGSEVRLRYAYLVTCTEVIKDATGRVTELRCVHDPASRGGNAPDGRKVRGTIHWVSAQHAQAAEARLYNALYRRADPGAEGDFVDDISLDSLEIVPNCQLEPELSTAMPGVSYQFERLGYFCMDPDSRPGQLVCNRTVALRDSWAKALARR